MSTRLIAILIAMTAFGSTKAFAGASCFCVVSINNLTNQTSATGVIKNYGSLATYTGLNQQGDTNQTNCNSKCTTTAAPDTGSQAIATAACAAGAGNGTNVIAWSAVGTKEYKSAQSLGILKRAAAVYNCPQGGALNGTKCVITVAANPVCPKDYWYEGGNTKKCVKQACPAGSMPGVAAWAAVGGAVNGGVYQTDAQGGTRFFINPTYSCDSGYNLSGTNCVKTYAANLVSPAVCKF
jgi:hypothetical protein